jgi:TRAP transporter 4TM/12TM fusion protein
MTTTATPKPATQPDIVRPDEAERIELSAEELEKLSSDSEGGPARRVTGWLGWLMNAIAFGLAAYALYWTQFSVNTTFYRASFLAITLLLIFILFPLVKDKGEGPQVRWGNREEWGTALGVGAVAAVFLFNPFMPGIRVEGPLDSVFFRGSFSTTLGALVIAGFLVYPLVTRSRFLARTQLLDWLFAIAAIWTALYLAIHAEALKTRATRPTPDDLMLAGVLVLLILEGTRRTVGWVLPAVTAVFLIYCYAGVGWLIPEAFEHRGFTVHRILGQNYLTLEGIFATPMDVAATFIILFTIYGAVLDRGGAGKFFIDWAFALFGKNPSPSAPGRAVVASGFLLGTVSGSGVATTVTVSSLAWPMLKRSGYNPSVAGGMLSAAGIGATLSPPTLGAAAFIIAEFLDVDYLQVLIYATIPTILYYVSCWLMTEADARRLGVKPVKTSNASLWELTRVSGYHFISLGAIAVFLVMGFTSFMAVFWSIAIAFLLSMVRAESRLVTIPAFGFGVVIALLAWVFGITDMPRALGLHEQFDGRLSVSVFWGMMASLAFSGAQALIARRAGAAHDPASTRMIEALIDGARSTLGIVATCACAGLIVSVVNLTGLGLTISSIIVGIGGESVLIILLLAALAMWVLGLSVPVTASYIIAAVMLVPALTKVGIPPAAAHMFMFYYAVLADVSPPTALAPFAASAITGGGPYATTMQAWKYTLPAFIVPFMFCLTPEGAQLLMLSPVVDGSTIRYVAPETFGQWVGIAVVTLTSCLALVGLCIGATGYALGHANVVERVLCTIGGGLLLAASLTTDAIGAVVLALGLALHWMRMRKQPPAPAPG